MGIKGQLDELERKQKELDEKVDILRKIFAQIELQFMEFKKQK